MKTTLKLITVLFVKLLLSCGGKEEKKKEKFSYQNKAESKETTTKKEENVPASKKIDLTNKGIGPISSITLDADIDQKMATHGADVFKKCEAVIDYSKNSLYLK